MLRRAMHRTADLGRLTAQSWVKGCYIYWSDDPGISSRSSRRSFEGKLC